MLDRCTLDLDPIDRGITFDSVSCSAVGLLSSRLYSLSLLWYMHSFESSGVVTIPMCLDSLKLCGCARTLQKKGRVLCREAGRYLSLQQLT
ncbi:hypothetical protein M9H77_31840 [Catharanthus roseus]|uniref:Uncharacterized protein n=1 Tax=Catharanthus roseus TaxID=4058 RepID=A0ACC0A5F7_CATRO|nr:hypothetical protein M9H77_31840 [Catharanthus roseus]